MMNYEKKEERMIILPIIGVIIIIIIFAICLTSFMFNKYDEINEKKNEEANHIQEVFDVNNIKKPDVSVNNVNDFSISFLKMENKKQNMLYSPLSIKYALKMLSEGANGNTKTQIDNVIGNESITKYENIEDVLSLANAAYIRDTYSNYIKESFKNTLIERYNAEVIYDSFENANNINNWIENKTLHIIKNMLKDEQVQKDDLVMFLKCVSNRYGMGRQIRHGKNI